MRNDGWANFFTGHGVFGQDKRLGGRFRADILSFDDMLELARGDDLAKRACETLPKEAFRQGWDLVISEEEDDEDEGERVTQVLDKLDVLGAQSVIKQALVWERVYGGAAVLMGVNDGQADLSKPLNLDKVKGIDWLTPLEARELMPVYGYADPRAPKYGQPEIYRLVTRAVLPSHDGKFTPITVDIHESRLLVFPGNRVSRYQTTAMQGGWGDSILTPMYRVLRDFNMTWASAGTLVMEFARGVYKFENLWETLAGDDKDAFAERLQAMELSASTINATVIDKNDDFIRQTTPIAGLPDLLDKFAVRLAAAADMPITLLFGTSPAGMNATGESDIRFFYDRVAQYQEERIMPQLKRLIQIIFRCTGVKQEPKKWIIRFRPLWQESAKDKASAMLTQAQADVAWIGAGVFSAEECAASHWESGEYNPEIKIDFAARDKQEQAVAAPIQQKDLNALNPEHPDYKASKLDPSHPDFIPAPAPKPGEAGYVEPEAPAFGKKAKGDRMDEGDETHPYFKARAWRKKLRDKVKKKVEIDDDDDGGDDGGGGTHPSTPPSSPPPAPSKKGTILGESFGGEDYTPPPSDPDEPDPNTPPQNPIKTEDASDIVTVATIKKQKDVKRLAQGKTGISKLNGRNVVIPTPPPAGEKASPRPPLGLRSDYSPEQVRGADGKWASDGGGEAERLAGEGSKAGGFTYDPRTGTQPAAGYSVAIHGDREKKIPGEKLTADAVRAYIKDNHDVLLRDPNAHVGAWFNPSDKTWYLDVPHVEKSIDTAVKLGQDNKQLGIYDLKRGETIHDHEYTKALGREGRFTGRVDSATGRHPSGLRSSDDDSRGNGGSDEEVREGAVRVDYAPDQARDEHGRFGAGGDNVRPSAIARVLKANGPWATEKDTPAREADAKKAAKVAAKAAKAARIANPTVKVPKPDPQGWRKDPKAEAEKEYQAQIVANQGKSLGGQGLGTYAEQMNKAGNIAREERMKSNIRAQFPNDPSAQEKEMQEQRLKLRTLPGQRELLDPGEHAFEGKKAQMNFEASRDKKQFEIEAHVRAHENPSLADKMVGVAPKAPESPDMKAALRRGHGFDLSEHEEEEPKTPGPSKSLKTDVPQNPQAERFANEEHRTDLAGHEIASVKPNADKGCMGSYVVKLDDGSKALWKPKEGEVDEIGGDKIRSSVHGGTYYLREAAFSKVADTLGVADLAPATVVHGHVDEHGASTGALQSWVTGTPARMTDQRIDRESSERMRVADYVTGNTDRHPGNMLVTDQGKPVMIDHGLTFPDSNWHSDRFIQPWDSISHETGPLLQSTVDQINRIDVPKMARILNDSGIDRESNRNAVMRALHVQRHPEILEVPTRASRYGSTWDHLTKDDHEDEHGATADAIMKDIK